MGWPRSLKKRPFLWLFLCPKSADFLLKLYTLWPLFDILESDSLAGAVGPQIVVPWSRICSHFPSEMAKKVEVLCEKITFGIKNFDHVFRLIPHYMAELGISKSHDFGVLDRFSGKRKLAE